MLVGWWTRTERGQFVSSVHNRAGATDRKEYSLSFRPHCGQLLPRAWKAPEGGEVSWVGYQDCRRRSAPSSARLFQGAYRGPQARVLGVQMCRSIRREKSAATRGGRENSSLGIFSHVLSYCDWHSPVAGLHTCDERSQHATYTPSALLQAATAAQQELRLGM